MVSILVQKAIKDKFGQNIENPDILEITTYLGFQYSVKIINVKQ